MTRFSEILRDRAATIWEQEHQHPFVVELGEGTLPLEKFQWYMKQDYLFLIDFSRVIALAVAKAETLEDMGWFARLLHETLNTEMSLHVSFCKEFGITEDELLATRLSPTTLAYTRPHALQRAFRHDCGNRRDPASMLMGLCRNRSDPRNPRQTDEPAALLPMDRDVQFDGIRRAGRMAPFVYGQDRARTLGRTAGQVDGDIRHEQQIRISLLGCRVPDGGLVRLGCN